MELTVLVCSVLRSYEGALDRDMSDMYYWGGGAPLAQGERGSMASLDSTLRKGAPTTWRQPELPEVIAMLNYRLDPVKSNAAAYLQHLTFKNDKVKSEVRRLKGIPSLVSLLDNPRKEVHHSACGALKNISYGRDSDNKIAIKNCDGVPALVRLLRRARDQDLTDTITGTLWNLSSHDSVKMEIVDHALNALSTEVMVPHSGWESGGEEESCKPRHLEWETSLTNTTGCLRCVSHAVGARVVELRGDVSGAEFGELRQLAPGPAATEGNLFLQTSRMLGPLTALQAPRCHADSRTHHARVIEARRKLRECSGLVDSIMYIVQSQINRKEVDSKLTENSVCLLRNLSYQVHREVPGFERYQEAVPLNQGPAPSSSQKTGCFSSRKGKGLPLLPLTPATAPDTAPKAHYCPSHLLLPPDTAPKAHYCPSHLLLPPDTAPKAHYCPSHLLLPPDTAPKAHYCPSHLLLPPDTAPKAHYCPSHLLLPPDTAPKAHYCPSHLLLPPILPLKPTTAPRTCYCPRYCP
ncbi:hypothetical protein JZ751_015430 [Albula glossodonta]|uniref:Uncharacterized protein n=1 Tax=Albula glossodonta TaxID=121402 RepID=A0A8T2MV78_9TELE|nr:hypothetical protein JZ751_015430 [Albula glossodonta]